MTTFESCCRRDVVALEFSNEFMIWAIIQTLHENYELMFLTNGWEI